MAEEYTSHIARRWRILLICSVLLNFVFVGIAGGLMLRGAFGNGSPRAFAFESGPIVGAFDRETRREIGKRLRADQNLRGFRAGAESGAVIEAIRAEPFDPAAFVNALEAMSSRAITLRTAAAEAMAAEIATMSTMERAELAARIEKPRRR